MSKLVEEVKLELKGIRAQFEQKKEDMQERHEEKKFAKELKHQMKHEK